MSWLLSFHIGKVSGADGWNQSRLWLRTATRDTNYARQQYPPFWRSRPAPDRLPAATPTFQRCHGNRTNVNTCAFVTDRVSQKDKAVGSISLSARLFPLYLLNRLTFELEFVCVWVGEVKTVARLRFKVKVMGQGQRSMYNAYGRGNVVTRSVLPRSSIENSFTSFFYGRWRS